MKIINSKLHGIIDYVVVAFLLLAPTLFSLPSTTSLFTYVQAGIHLMLTTTTQFEYGIFKIVPLKIHAIIELIVSIALVAVAFVLGNIDGEAARLFYLLFAAAVFITWLMTDYVAVKSNA
jgi:hypothetical protein